MLVYVKLMAASGKLCHDCNATNIFSEFRNICHLLHALHNVICIRHADLPDEAHTKCCIRFSLACLQNKACSILINAKIVLQIDRQPSAVR